MKEREDEGERLNGYVCVGVNERERGREREDILIQRTVLSITQW